MAPQHYAVEIADDPFETECRCSGLVLLETFNPIAS